MKPKVTKTRVTPAEKAAYLDTEVCRLYGYVPVGWRRDEDGLWLVLRPKKVEPKEPTP